jgi:hypothetical protein
MRQLRLVLLLLAAAALLASALDVVVHPVSSAPNTVATLTAARDLVRAARAAGNTEHATVTIHAGTYGPLTLDRADLVARE